MGAQNGKVLQAHDETAAGRALLRDAAVFEPLVARKLISREDLDAAVGEARSADGDLEVLLLERYKVPRRELGEVLSGYYKYPLIQHDAKFIIDKGLVEDLNPQYLKRNLWVPLWREDTTVHVLARDPQSFQTVQDVQQAYPGHNIRYYIGLRCDIEQFIASILSEEGSNGEKTIAAILEGSPAATVEISLESEPEVQESDNVVVRLANQILYDACAAGASDIHIEPYHDKEMMVRFRVDGDCTVYQKIPAMYRRALVSRIKIMAGLDIAERRRPQDGKITFRLPQRTVELRAAVIPTARGNEDVVLRVLHSGEAIPLEKLELSEANLREISALLQLPHGIFLCVGPTGSGKTTTLHSALSYLNGPDIKIWTAEDPVEITQYGLRQVQIHPKAGLTFAAAMRAFLRADPDVIMVGEMRDKETMDIAIEASLTGHLVLSTLHTNGAAETVTRLLDMGIDPYNYADALLGVLAQRLVRRLCDKCREAYHPPRKSFDELARYFTSEELARLTFHYDDDFKLYQGKGCRDCNYTGYRGQLALHELLVASGEVKKLIQDRAPTSEIVALARAQGRLSLLQDGILKCLKGLTDFSRVRAVVPP